MENFQGVKFQETIRNKCGFEVELGVVGEIAWSQVFMTAMFPINEILWQVEDEIIQNLRLHYD